MGLDMFLDYRRIADSIPGKPTLNEHMYWRKANAIHKFFIDTCADGIDRDPKIVKEIYRTIGVTNTVLEEWPINEHHPLRFYAEKPTWFDRYSI